jgi:hypothetical protein
MAQKNVGIPSMDHLDEAITVVGIKGWVFLAASLLLFVPIVLWAFLGTVPTAVTGKCLFFDPSNSSRPENLEIYGFLPLFANQSILPGMEVECALDALDIGRSGMLKGTVKEVVPFPVDLTEKHMEQIPSKSLREYLLSSNNSIPLILVIATPLAEKDDPSKFVWTYGRDPMVHLQSGITGTITIILSREKPISYVIPSLLSASGKK